jgi:protein-disulfide isomerase/uncharacterized membrane protein
MSSANSATLACKKALVCLTGIGLCVAVVALYEYVVFTRGLARGPSFCNVSAHINCEVVNASAWSSFFGFPIAAYGIFFYLVLLGVLAMAGPGRAVNADQARPVLLLLVTVAALVSLTLFGISEFVIGALCLLCLGIYVTNFALLGVVVWSRGTAGLVRELGIGIKETLGFFLSIVSGKKALLRYLAALLLVATLSALSPEIMYRVARAVTGQKPRSDVAAEDAVARWSAAPVDSIVLQTEAGAFGDYSQGDAKAPVQIVEFADLECPGCRLLHIELKTILEQFQGQYRLVFKNYPLDADCNPGITRPFHTTACFAAQFTRCAGEQGRFWESLNLAITSPHLEEVLDTPAAKASLVKDGVSQLGLDQEAIETCLSSERYRDVLLRDIREGDRLGLQSTPSFWINGKKVVPPTPDSIARIIRVVLKDSTSEASGSGGTP